MKILSSYQWYRTLGAIGCAAVIIGGCASTAPPTEQMAVSKSAIANAVSAGGSEYAPVEMRGEGLGKKECKAWQARSTRSF